MPCRQTCKVQKFLILSSLYVKEECYSYLTLSVMILVLSLCRPGLLRLCCDMSHWIALSPLQSRCLMGCSDVTGEQLPQRGRGLTSPDSAVSVVETWIAGWNTFAITRLIQSGLSPSFEEWILDTFWGLLALCWISLLQSFCHSTVEQLFPP